MYSLKETTKRNKEKCTGLPYTELVKLDHDEQAALVRQVRGGEVVFPEKRDPRKTSCGNPLLALRRFRTMEEVDKRLLEIANGSKP
jgi:hypothetical protein